MTNKTNFPDQRSTMFAPSGSSLLSEMSFLVLVAVTFLSALFLYKVLRRGHGAKTLPSGSMGLPLIGESVSFLRAQKEDRGEEWINKRVAKHGPVFKTSLMGSPTVVVIGQAGNKFVFGSDDNVLTGKQPKSFTAIAGKHQIFALTGARYKLIKGAMVSFLRPESLQNYISHMDDLVKTELLKETKEKETIMAVTFMKKLTFNIACSILFGIHDEPIKEALFTDFTLAFKAIWSIPVNFPGTLFRQGLQARSRIIKKMLPIVKKRKEELSKGTLSPRSDVISCMLALKAENQELITEEEIMDNFILLMIASHDTSATLLSLMVWKLARAPELYQKVLEEQMGILKDREEPQRQLTWNDIQKMKFTWRVAQELMRIIPPVFGNFRRAVKDTSFGGYDIPKGWQVFWVSNATHMNKDIFNDPTEFNPSRFENPSKPIPPLTYIPFGAGHHMCIGNEFARVETLIIIHHMVTKFDWSQVNPDEMITRQPMPYPSMGLPIMLNARNPSEKA
ncbi:hypothetical protein HHK36_016020 [Tetracentron sinense]|uniref:Cytochrome P450 n=1 Tax=Tetracentron sinense TaxID=13715 RepID=A0A835DAM4_TETSI|nr:hypothetical protein HHK36_016020 [Tetracentron sinense]